MAVRATKVFEDLKLRSPQRILNWMIEHFKPLLPQRSDVVYPVQQILKRKSAINLEAAVLLNQLLRAIGYTPTIYFIHDRVTRNNYAITVYFTMGVWHWLEWFDPIKQGIYEYDSKEALIDDFRRYYIGRYSTYTDFVQLRNFEMNDYVSMDEDLDKLIAGPSLETRLDAYSVLPLTTKTIHFFCEKYPLLKTLPMEDDTYAGYLLYDPRQGVVIGFLQWVAYTHRLLSFAVSEHYAIQETLKALLLKMVETQSVYYAELTERSLGDYESVFREVGFTITNRDREYKTAQFEYFGPHRVIPKNPYGSNHPSMYGRF